MATRTARIKQSLGILRRALEGFESSLSEFEEAPEGELLERKETVRPRSREGPPQLLPIPGVCQGLGMGKSWVYRRLKGGEMPGIKMRRSVELKRAEL
jgi:predicted DNA-binding transcriptional regulator AlpA